MSALRTLLRNRAVNRAVRGAGKLVLPTRRFEWFDYRLPVIDDFSITLPCGQAIHWSPPGDTAITKFLRYGGWNGYERESVELFYELAVHAPVTFDVGAYLGYFAALAAGARPGNRAFAFEPVPGLARLCCAMARRNPSLQIEVVEAAAGAAAGTLELFLGDDPLATDTSTDPAFRQGRRATPVAAIRLDDFVSNRKLDRVDLMKIDTESTEPDVLRGAAETIRRFQPVILLEVLNVARTAELDTFLSENDYACASVTDRGLILQPRVIPDDTGRFPNYLFYPRRKEGPVADVIRSRMTG